jgi:hypothetical protein
MNLKELIQDAPMLHIKDNTEIANFMIKVLKKVNENLNQMKIAKRLIIG